MYAGVDIGGTKTLLATLDDKGVITAQTKFPTPPDYGQFIKDLAKAVASFTSRDWQAAVVAAPGRINLMRGVVDSLSNLPWQSVPLQRDAQEVLGCPVQLENDANLAGLSEARLHPEAETVLYLTVSTGIGTGLIKHGQIESGGSHHPEGGLILLPYRGRLEKWEAFASGHAIVQIFGKPASDITDPADWRLIARHLSLGLLELIAITQPDLIIIGGSIGTYFDHYGAFLADELKGYETPMTPIPPIIQAARPEEAVIYGCYEYAKTGVKV